MTKDENGVDDGFWQGEIDGKVGVFPSLVVIEEVNMDDHDLVKVRVSEVKGLSSIQLFHSSRFRNILQKIKPPPANSFVKFFYLVLMKSSDKLLNNFLLDAFKIRQKQSSSIYVTHRNKMSRMSVNMKLRKCRFYQKLANPTILRFSLKMVP